MTLTRKDMADAHLAAIWANQLQLKKFLGIIDGAWLEQIIEDMKELQVENQNYKAKDSVCTD